MGQCQANNQKMILLKKQVQRRITISSHIHILLMESPLRYQEESREVTLVPRIDIPPRILFFLTVVAPVLIPSKLESNRTIISYNPQGIMKQFGFDQGSLIITGETSFLASVNNQNSLMVVVIKFFLILNIFLANSRQRGHQEGLCSG